MIANHVHGQGALGGCSAAPQAHGVVASVDVAEVAIQLTPAARALTAGRHRNGLDGALTAGLRCND